MTDDLSRDAVSLFVDSDEAYLRWIDEHPNGFVINCARTPTSNYLVLHRSSCWAISTSKRTNWTTGDLIKVTSPYVEALKEWALDAIGGEVTPCGKCNPDAQWDEPADVAIIDAVEVDMLPNSSTSTSVPHAVPRQIDSGCEELDRAWKEYVSVILERPDVLIPDTEDDLNWHAFLGHSLDMQGFRAAEFVGVDPLSRSAPDFIPLKTRGIGVRRLGGLWKVPAIREHLLGKLRGIPVQASLDVIAAQGGDIGVSLADAFAAFPYRKGHWTVRALLENSAALEDDGFSFRNWLQRVCESLGASDFPPRDFREIVPDAAVSIEMALRRELQNAFYQVGPALAPYMICDWQLWLWAEGKTTVFANFKLDSFHEEFVKRFGRDQVPKEEQAFAEWWLKQFPELPPRLANECIWLAMEHDVL